MKNLSVLIVFMFFANCGPTQKNDSQQEKVEIFLLDFNMTSVVSVDCSVIESFRQINKIEIKDKSSMSDYLKLSQQFKEISNVDFDARGKISFVMDGKTDSYCFNKKGVFLKDNLCFKNDKLFEMILGNYDRI